MSEPKKVEIVPAVLVHSWSELEESLAKVASFATHVQIDVVDGHFARGKTWPYKDHASFDTIAEAGHGLPYWDSLDFEFDLMVNNPALELPRYRRAGASRIVVHADSPGAAALFESMVERDDGGEYAIKLGVGLAAHADPHTLAEFEGYDFVQVMGIEHIGRQGEPFDPDNRALYLLERLRALYPRLPIQVDGGVRPDNVATLIAAGATRLVVGSAILAAEDPHVAYDALVALANPA